MKRALVAALAIALIAATPPSNYCISRATLVAQVTAGQLTWKTSAPAGWSTDNTEVTWTDFTNNVSNTGSCTKPGGSAYALMSWGQMIACATNHTVSQQSQAFIGSYQTVYYNTTYNSKTGLYTCSSPQGTTGYSGTPITLPAGTVAPTSASTELSLSITNVAFTGSNSISVTLYNPSGVQVDSFSAIVAPNSSGGPYTYYASGAPSGAWYWQIVQSGGSVGTCDSSSGSSGGGTQVQWSGTAYFYE